MTNKRKAVGYFRFSSENQTENSIAYQRAAALTYCAGRDIELVDEYVDEARTATNDKRPAFQRLMKDAVEHPEWDMVIVYDYSRFARNSGDALKYTSLLEDVGIELASITQTFDNSNEGFLMKGLTHLLNEYYSRNNSKHTHAGMKEKALVASHCGGKPPLGYDVDANHKLIVNEYEAEIVRMIFNYVDTDVSYAKMAKILNEEGYRTKKGKPFNKNSFDSILSQEKYIGVYSWNKTRKKKSDHTRNSHAKKPLEEQIRIENAIPAIIDRELFDRVQQKRDTRVKGTAVSKACYHYMLSGLKVLKCAECGSYLIGTARSSHGKRYMTYYCPKHKINECSFTEIRADELEYAVAYYIASDLRHRKDLTEISAELRLNNTYDLMLKRKADIEKSIVNLVKTACKSPSEEITKQLRTLSEEKAAIIEQLKTHENKVTELTEDNIVTVCKKFLDHLMTSEDIETRMYLKEVIKEIVVDHEKVEITLNIA